MLTIFLCFGVVIKGSDCGNLWKCYWIVWCYYSHYTGWYSRVMDCVKDVNKTVLNSGKVWDQATFDINIRAWLRGFRVKIADFSSFLCPSILKRDLDSKKTTPNIEVWPESLGAKLEYRYSYRYIERGLFNCMLLMRGFVFILAMFWTYMYEVSSCFDSTLYNWVSM